MSSNLNMNIPRRVVLDRTLNNTYILRNVGVYPTFACNQNCSYCPHMGHGILPKDQSQYISKEHVDAIPRFVSKHQHKDVPLIVGISGGEPTIDWDRFIYISETLQGIENVKDRNLTTNLVRKYSVDELGYIANRFSGIYVSIDGKKETQDLRSAGSYDQSMENLITLLSIARSTEARPFIQLSMTITADNYKHLYENVRFFTRMGVNFSATLDDTSQAKRSLTKEEKQEYLVGVMQQVKSTKKDFGWPKSGLTGLLLNCERKDAHNTANILPDGKVYRCNINPAYPITDLSDPEFTIDYSGLDTFSVVEHDQYCMNCELKPTCQYCYASTTTNREFYCAAWRLFSKYENLI